MKNQILTKSERNWYIIYTHSNFERIVKRTLAQKQINCFLPMKTVTRVWSDRRKIMEVPAFPNYLFVNIEPANRFQILSVSGVSSFVSFDKKPATISDREIDCISQLLATETICVEQNFENGDHIQIVDGPFTGFFGTLIERKGKMRFCVRLAAINYSISIEISSSSFRRVSICENRHFENWLVD